MVTLTSFKNSHRCPGRKYSLVRFQPDGYGYDELTALAPITKEGYDISFNRLFRKCPDEYEFGRRLDQVWKMIELGFASRFEEIFHWAQTLTPNEDVVLCSWAPYNTSSQRQIKKYGVFACHTGIVGRWLLFLRPDIEVKLDCDRNHAMIPGWQYQTRSAVGSK